LVEKFKEEIDQASWAMLKDHHERGAVFLVRGVELADVGVALATDDTSKVKLWLDNKELSKVEDEDSEKYSETLHEKNFDFLIIQPYVLVKLLN
ncbi:MAG: DUF2288 family protein, partial [Bacteriovoracaceae bacterium]|nr:DUF2288 family protein [Bacteriovoracaceae bacterium]